MLESREGDVVEANPPPPPKLTLPQLLLKALGPASAAARKAALVPWSAKALQEGCAKDQTLVAGASHAQITLEWVFEPLARCRIREHSENKGTWRWDSKQRGAWARHPLPGMPLRPVPEGINVGSLSLLNFCGDPRDVRFGTAHFTWPSSIGSHIWYGAASEAREGGPLCGLVGCCPPPPPAPCRTRRPAPVPGLAGRHTENRHRAPQGGHPCRGRPPAPADVMADPVAGPTASTHFRTAMAAVQAKGAPTCFEVCVLVC